MASALGEIHSGTCIHLITAESLSTATWHLKNCSEPADTWPHANTPFASAYDLNARSKPKPPTGYPRSSHCTLRWTNPVHSQDFPLSETLYDNQLHAWTVKLEEEFPPKPCYGSGYTGPHSSRTRKMDELISSKRYYLSIYSTYMTQHYASSHCGVTLGKKDGPPTCRYPLTSTWT
jgi:hypothetical protein